MATHGQHGAETDQSGVEQLSEAKQQLLARVEQLLRDCHPEAGALSDLPQITVDPLLIARVCNRLKNDPSQKFDRLLCLSCVDYKDHIQVVYFLHSLENELMLVVKVNLPYEDLQLPTVASVWRAAEWYEREAHDLFGVIFEGNPNLSPLLLYEGFEGYPGRKEYSFYDYQEF